MNITEDSKTAIQELTPETLVGRLLGEKPSMDNFHRGIEDIKVLIDEAQKNSIHQNN